MIYDYVNLSSFSNREIDKNGFMHVKNCIVTKSEVNQYRGNEIPEWQSLGLDPNKIYDVLRPAEEIEKSLDQMRGIPILDDHDDVHDAEHPRQHMRIGSMGTAPEFKEPEVSAELTFWNKKEIDEINTKQRDNLSMGYDYTAVLENGEYNGKKYTVRMKDIVWNHVALVDKGRVDGARVSDSSMERNEEKKILEKLNDIEKHYKDIFSKNLSPDLKRRELEAYRKEKDPLEKRLKELEKIINRKNTRGEDAKPFSQKEAERRLLPNKREDFMQRLVAAYKDIFGKGRDMATKKGKDAPEAPSYQAAVKQNNSSVQKRYAELKRRKQQYGLQGAEIEEFARLKKSVGDKKKLPMAGSKTGDRNMATKKKRNGDAEPAVGGSEEQEEVQENRVVAGIKALLSEFDNVHEEQGIDPGVTDEEANCLEKVRDFLDSFHNQGSEDEPGEEAGTSMDPMDEDPEYGEDEDPEEEMGEDEQWPDNGSSPTGDRKRRGMDAAMIEKRITEKFRAKDRALDECADLLGSVGKARVLDSAFEVYAHTLKTNGIEIPKGANLDGLRGMVTMLRKSRAADSMPASFTKPTGVEAQVQETIVNSPYASMIQ